eukprot:gene4375-6662_t
MHKSGAESNQRSLWAGSAAQAGRLCRHGRGIHWLLAELDCGRHFCKHKCFILTIVSKTQHMSNNSDVSNEDESWEHIPYEFTQNPQPDFTLTASMAPMSSFDRLSVNMNEIGGKIGNIESTKKELKQLDCAYKLQKGYQVEAVQKAVDGEGFYTLQSEMDDRVWTHGEISTNHKELDNQSKTNGGISNFRHQNASKTENIASESTHTKSYKSTTDVASPFSTFTNSDAAPIQTPDDNLSPRNSSSTPMKIDNSEFLSADRDTPWKNNCSSDTADLQSTKEEEYLRILFSTDEVLSRLSNVDGNKKRPLATKRRSSVSHKDVAASNKMDASQVHDILEQSDNILSYLQSATTSPNISSHHRTVSLNHSESPSRFGLAQPYSPNASASSRSNIPRHLLGEQNHFERSQQTQVHVNKDNTEFSRSYPQLSNSATLSAETKSFVRFVHPLINLPESTITNVSPMAAHHNFRSEITPQNFVYTHKLSGNHRYKTHNVASSGRNITSSDSGDINDESKQLVQDHDSSQHFNSRAYNAVLRSSFDDGDLNFHKSVTKPTAPETDEMTLAIKKLYQIGNTALNHALDTISMDEVVSKFHADEMFANSTVSKNNDCDITHSIANLCSDTIQPGITCLTPSAEEPPIVRMLELLSPVYNDFDALCDVVLMRRPNEARAKINHIKTATYGKKHFTQSRTGESPCPASCSYVVKDEQSQSPLEVLTGALITIIDSFPEHVTYDKTMSSQSRALHDFALYHSFKARSFLALEASGVTFIVFGGTFTCVSYELGLVLPCHAPCINYYQNFQTKQCCSHWDNSTGNTGCLSQPLPSQLKTKLIEEFSSLSAHLHLHHIAFCVGHAFILNGVPVQANLPQEIARATLAVCRHSGVVAHTASKSRHIRNVVIHGSAALCVVLCSERPDVSLIGSDYVHVMQAHECLTHLEQNGVFNELESFFQEPLVPVASAGFDVHTLTSYDSQSSFADSITSYSPRRDYGSSSSLPTNQEAPQNSPKTILYDTALQRRSGIVGVRRRTRVIQKALLLPYIDRCDPRAMISVGRGNAVFHYFALDSQAGLAIISDTHMTKSQMSIPLQRYILDRFFCFERRQKENAAVFPTQRPLAKMLEHGLRFILQSPSHETITKVVNPATRSHTLGRPSKKSASSPTGMQRNGQDEESQLFPFSYWVVGRLLEPRQQNNTVGSSSSYRELYVCFRDGSAQNMAEMAFKLFSCI